jgi:hypothetical protein
LGNLDPSQEAAIFPLRSDGSAAECRKRLRPNKTKKPALTNKVNTLLSMKEKENGWNDNLQPNSYNWNVKFWFKMEIYFRMLHHFISICLASHKKYETQKV